MNLETKIDLLLLIKDTKTYKRYTHNIYNIKDIEVSLVSPNDSNGCICISDSKPSRHEQLAQLLNILLHLKCSDG
jgi:hypothetical protein